MPRPTDLSSVPVTAEATESQLHRASFDPHFSVDVVEALVYEPATSTLNRMVQPLSANQFISANITGGSITTSPLSADSSSVSAKSEDAGQFLVSAAQKGTWTLSSLLTEGTAFIGQVSATLKGSSYVSSTIDNGSVSAKQGTYPWSVSGNVSAALNEGTNFLGNVSATIKNYPVIVSGQVSANIDSGSISAKSGDANQFHVSAVQGDAGLLRVSSIGGSFSLSADASGNRVSALSNDADQLRISSLSKDAGLFRVSALGGTSSPLSADSSSVSAIQDDAGKLRVSSIGGSFSLSADASGNRVSALSNDADQLRTSSLSKDAGLFRVSAIGGTAGDNILVDGSDQTVSAKLIQVSASVSSSFNTLLTRITSYDAANAHISAYQGGSWTLSAFLNEGSVSAKSTDANQLHVSAVQGDAGLLRVSSIGATSQYVSAFIDNGSVSAKQGTSPWIVSGSVSAVVTNDTSIKTTSGNAVSASQYGTWSVSANITNTVGVTETSPVTRVSADLLGGSIDNTAFGATQSGTWAISSLGKEGTAFLGNVSATIKNYPLTVSGTVSTFINEGSVSAIQSNAGSLRVSALIDVGYVSAAQTDATNLRVSAIQSDAGLAHVSANQMDAGSLHVSSFVDSGSVSAKQGSYPWSVSGNVSAFINQGTVSAYSPDAGLFRTSTDTAVLTTDNGMSKFFLSAASAGLASVKSTAGRVYGYSMGNNLNAAPLYVQFFDHTASAVTLGTTVPDWQIHIPPSGAANMMMDPPISFVSALYVAATSANVGGSSPNTNGQITLFYK